MLSFLALTILAFQFLLASSSPTKCSGCKVKNPASLMKLPAGIPAPTEELSYVAVAIGTQNYTCSSAGTYTLDGALANLFDISCLTSSPATFNEITDAAMALWERAPPNLSAQKVMNGLGALHNPVLLGQHYYVINPLTQAGLNPKWDFTSAGAMAGNQNAYVVAAKSAGAAAPTGSKDIDWVLLNNIGAGGLADFVYRTDTKLGQAPSSCTPGSGSVYVKYAAKYWLFGGSVEKN